MQLLLALLPLLGGVYGSTRRSKYGCEGTLVHLECEAGTTISPVRANFGRFDAGVCNSEGNQAWSTRCIQPTTLRQVNKECEGRTTCSIDVTSAVFGDPCPGTYKYLEVHYTCVNQVNRPSRTNNLPPWLLAMSATTAKPAPATTTTPTTTTTRQEEEDVIEVEEMVEEVEDYPALLESLEYLEEDQENEMTLEDLLFSTRRKEVFINLPLTEPEVETLEFEEDRTVLIATLVSVICCTLVIFISALLYTRIKQKKVVETGPSFQQFSPNQSQIYDYESVSSGSSTVSSIYTTIPTVGSVYTTLPNGDTAIIIPLGANPAYLNTLLQQNKPHYFNNNENKPQFVNLETTPQQLLNPSTLHHSLNQENIYIDIDQFNKYQRY